MSIFDAFSPEAIFRNLVGAMGISPEEMQAALKLLFSELNALHTERAAFKQGASETVTYFAKRLDAQDAQLARIEVALERLAPSAPVLDYASNGKELTQ